MASHDRPRGGFWSSWTRPERVPARPRNGFERPRPPKIKFVLVLVNFSSIADILFDDFGSIFARLSRSVFCFFFARSLNTIKGPNAKEKKNACRLRERLAFGPSSLPTRLARSTTQLASQRFTRSIMQPPHSKRIKHNKKMKQN